MSRTSDLVKAMVNIRDQDRLECGRDLFEKLGHPDSLFITESQLDELLFKTVRKCLGTSIHADMLLMAFGLLPGYEHNCLSLGKRRIKFVRESNWLKVNRRSKIKDPGNASEADLDSAAKSLLNVEKYWMKKIADEFIKQIKRKDENGKEIKNPIENYMKLLDRYMEEVRDASGKIIDYIPKVPPSPPLDNENNTTDEEATDSKETNKQDTSGEAPLPDEPDTPPPPEDNSATTGDEQDNYSKVKPQPGKPTPPSNLFRIHISRNINHSIIIQFGDLNIRLQWLILSACAVVLVVGFLICVCFLRSTNEPSVQNNVLIPGEIMQLVIVMPSSESADTPLKYISSDPDLIEVSSDGFLLAHQGQPGETNRTADIVIQSENEILETQTFTVDFTQDPYEPPVEDIDDFVPDFLVEQKIRLAGTDDWDQTIVAKVGDKVEYQIMYHNTSNEQQNNIVIKDILPNNAQYVTGSTRLFNTLHPEGEIVKQDNVVTTGINIGAYKAGANAYVRFTAEIVDNSLQPGMNTLANWSQASVGSVTLQGYTAIYLHKSS